VGGVLGRAQWDHSRVKHTTKEMMRKDLSTGAPKGTHLQNYASKVVGKGGKAEKGRGGSGASRYTKSFHQLGKTLIDKRKKEGNSERERGAEVERRKNTSREKGLIRTSRRIRARGRRFRNQDMAHLLWGKE